jgi:signal transduction histidine kinase
VGHDFNNLLTVIGGCCDLLRPLVQTVAGAEDLLDEMDLARERGVLLTQQLVAFSRNQTPKTQRIPLNARLASLLKMLRRVLPSEIELITQPDPEAGAVHIDPGQFDQVILNLTLNARDAMPFGGRLTLATARVEVTAGRAGEGMPSGLYAVLSVTDTGTGMSNEVRARIFEPFFTTKVVGKGTGLGLTIVSGIIKEHGGHIEVETAVGKGTTFRVYLPRYDLQG